MNTFRIRLRGQVDVTELNPMSPHQMHLIGSDPRTTLIAIRTDQAGLIGLMRHLHNLGFEMISIDSTTMQSFITSERKEA